MGTPPFARARPPRHRRAAAAASSGRSRRAQFKRFALDTAVELLARKAEQEAALLSLVVNKLGDPERKIAARAGSALRDLLRRHGAMTAVVVREVREERATFEGAALDETVTAPPREPSEGAALDGTTVTDSLAVVRFGTRAILTRETHHRARQVQTFLMRANLSSAATHAAIAFLNQARRRGSSVCESVGRSLGRSVGWRNATPLVLAAPVRVTSDRGGDPPSPLRH